MVESFDIDTFFVLDFDRCLGNYDANVKLKMKVVDELSIIGGRAFRLAHDEIKANGISFRILDYLRENDPSVDIDVFQHTFIKYAQSNPGSLLEPGANEFMNFLRSTNYGFCFMSFGDKAWQTTKIIAAGFEDVAKIIVSNEYKGRNIAEWFSVRGGYFVIPGGCFLDGVSRKAREIILLDDKVKAFNGLPDRARGYLLQDISRIYLSPQGKIPSSVKRVTRLDEIIKHESRLIQKTYQTQN